MKRILTIFLIILAFVSPSASYADENRNVFTMEELSIHLMPEFSYHPNDQKKDHAPLLIGYQGAMINNSNQPQKGQIEIPLPVNGKNVRIGYVADYSGDLKKAYEIEYTVDLERGTISWTTSEEVPPQGRYKFVIEFYSDSLKADGAKKSLDYQFTSFADIGLVSVTFIKPEKAAKLKLTPAPDENNSHADGGSTFNYLYQGIKAGEQKSFSMTYQRKETKPTIELMDSNDDQANSEKKSNYLAVGAFGGVSLLSLGAITVIFKNRRKNQ